MKQTLNLRQQLSINLGYCYSSRRATQNMLASRTSTTIAINLRGLPLWAVTLAALPAILSACDSYMRQNVHHCNFQVHLRSFCCHVIVTQQRPIVEQFAPNFRNLPLQAKKRIKWTASSSLHVTRTGNLSLVQCECHIGKKSAIARINPTNQN